WKGAGLAERPGARLRLEYAREQDRVRAGYVVDAEGQEVRNVPTLSAHQPGAPLFMQTPPLDQQ
ncbi:MAG TPA: hypothetical protein VFU47_02960, partial [Armatimonadota bacterium]|nr:hypothetical protein [Armatimonadota bacterium]